ncbi:MAG: hypothetical protein H0T84_06865 [Tatlockia sp.]|nr:hypothetical protein [Tatlockia sp.]
MSITVIEEDEQSTHLDTYNQGKAAREKIPLVIRNFNSGWPLLQVSLFSPKPDTNPMEYMPVLGGGNCHVVDVAALTLGELLTRIPGKIVVTTGATELKKEDINPNKILKFLKGFKIEHSALKIVIQSNSGPYGKMLTVNFPKGTGDGEKLRNALWNSYAFAFENGKCIGDFGKYENEESYTTQQFQNALNKEMAIFSNGQVFIDLGELLDKHVKDDKIKEYLQAIFKVDDFLELKKLNAKVAPQEVLLRAADLNRLEKFRDNKLALNENNLLGSVYTDSINNFYEAAVKIRNSDNLSIHEQKHQLKQLAQQQFKHRDFGERLLADALMIISFVGLAVGFYRMAVGNTFFFSTEMTAREKDFTNNYLNIEVQDEVSQQVI